MTSVVALVADLIEKGETELRPQWVDAAKCAQIREACKRVGTEWLKPIKDALPEEISYEEIRLVVAELRWKKKQKGKAA